jgi:GNAT superfamily N-acetyltransferase
VAAKRKSGEVALLPPEPIASSHDLRDFESGEPTLDDWLRRRALRNEASGGSRSYVVCATSSHRVIAYYCLSAGAVAHAAAPGRVRRNMPEPIPVLVIGRLAVDRRYQGRGLGRALLRDAILRTIQAASIAGIRAILVHAISENARRFYEQSGFHPSPIDPMTLMITVAEAELAATASK